MPRSKFKNQLTVKLLAFLCFAGIVGTTLLAIPIDHCLLSQDIHAIDMHTGTPVGSDHLPIVVSLVIPNDK